MASGNGRLACEKGQTESRCAVKTCKQLIGRAEKRKLEEINCCNYGGQKRMKEQKEGQSKAKHIFSFASRAIR